MKITSGNQQDTALKALLLRAGCLAGLLFVLLAIAVQFPVTTQWETALLWQVHQWQQPAFNQLAFGLAYLGGMPGMMVATLLVSIAAFYKQRIDLSYFAWAAFLGAVCIGWLAKAGFSRGRPVVWEQIAPFYGDSFPSNHSLYAVTLAGMLLVMTLNTSWRRIVLWSGVLWSFAMGFSRVYLGAHFPTDVLAGWSLAMAWLGWLCWLFIHFDLFRVNPFSSNPFQHRASRLAGKHEV